MQFVPRTFCVKLESNPRFIGKVHQLFGAEAPQLLEAMNQELAA